VASKFIQVAYWFQLHDKHILITSVLSPMRSPANALLENDGPKKSPGWKIQL